MRSTETRSRLQVATRERTSLRSKAPARSALSNGAAPQLSSSINFPEPSLDVPEAEVQRLRLDSWKAIASYLEREVRTVQRWERTEHLPVHRHYHNEHCSVYAFSWEVDEWRESRRVSTTQAAVVKPSTGQADVVPLANEGPCSSAVMEETTRTVKEVPCTVLIFWCTSSPLGEC